MGLIAGFIAIAGLIGGLALLVVWAGVLERWVDEPGGSADTLESMLSADGLDAATVTESAVSESAGSDADRFVLPPAA